MSRLKRLMKKTPGVIEWSFDLEDCDSVFRLVSMGIPDFEVKELLAKSGIEATEYDDFDASSIV